MKKRIILKLSIMMLCMSLITSLTYVTSFASLTTTNGTNGLLQEQLFEGTIIELLSMANRNSHESHKQTGRKRKTSAKEINNAKKKALSVTLQHPYDQQFPNTSYNDTYKDEEAFTFLHEEPVVFLLNQRHNTTLQDHQRDAFIDQTHKESNADVIKFLLKTDEQPDETQRQTKENTKIKKKKRRTNEGGIRDKRKELESIPTYSVAVADTIKKSKSTKKSILSATEQYKYNKQLQKAAQMGDSNYVEILLDAGANVETVEGILDYTALHRAAWHGHDEVLKVLLQYGANIEAVDEFGKTPLHLASRNNCIESVKILLQKGANIEAVDERGWTPLHLAALNGAQEVVNLLLEKQANVNAVDKDNFTSLHLAAYFGKKAIVDMLIKYGADEEAVDEGGNTPLHLAAQNGHEAIVDMLINYGATTRGYR